MNIQILIMTDWLLIQKEVGRILKVFTDDLEAVYRIDSGELSGGTI